MSCLPNNITGPDMSKKSTLLSQVESRPSSTQTTNLFVAIYYLFPTTCSTRLLCSNIPLVQWHLLDIRADECIFNFNRNSCWPVLCHTNSSHEKKHWAIVSNWWRWVEIREVKPINSMKRVWICGKGVGHRLLSSTLLAFSTGKAIPIMRVRELHKWAFPSLSTIIVRNSTLWCI